MRKEAVERVFVHSAKMNPRLPQERLFRLLKKARMKVGLCEIPSRGLPKIPGPRELANDAHLGLRRNKPVLSLPKGRMKEIQQNAGKLGVFQQPGKENKGDYLFEALFLCLLLAPLSLLGAISDLFSSRSFLASRRLSFRRATRIFFFSPRGSNIPFSH